ncbi:MAG: LuxR C-terminal-related transcriptional regulator [Thermoleophilia bacterium]
MTAQGTGRARLRPAPDSDGAGPDALHELLAALHGSLQQDAVVASWLEGAPSVIGADAYALYRVDADPLRIAAMGERGGTRLFVDRYEAGGYQEDPLLEHVLATQEPVHEGQLFTDPEWQQHRLRRHLGSRKLMRMLLAPLTLDGRISGCIYFTRRPQAAPFSEADRRNAGLIAHHLALALRNAQLLAQAQQGEYMASNTLDLIGSGVVITDVRGEPRFSNTGARRLLDGASGTMAKAQIAENVDHVVTGPRRDTVAIGSFSNNEASVIIRSQRLREDDELVATFLYSQSASVEGSRFSPLLGLLSEREVEVLEMIARGAKTMEIARTLYVSTDTVQYYVRRMFAVMDAGSRAELLAKAHAIAGISPG